MDGEPSLQFESAGGAVPLDIVLAPGQKIQLSSVVARWDGAAASGTFKPCLSIYSQDGVLVSRTFPGTDMAPGDSGVVTYAPFLGDEDAAAPASSTLPWVSITRTTDFVVANGSFQTLVDYDEKAHVEGTALDWDLSAGRIIFLENGIYSLSANAQWDAASLPVAPFQFQISASVDHPVSPGSIHPRIQDGEFALSTQPGPTAMGSDAIVYMTASIVVAIRFLTPSATNFAVARLGQVSGVDKTLTRVELLAVKLGELV